MVTVLAAAILLASEIMSSEHIGTFTQKHMNIRILDALDASFVLLDALFVYSCHKDNDTKTFLLQNKSRQSY